MKTKRHIAVILMVLMVLVLVPGSSTQALRQVMVHSVLSNTDRSCRKEANAFPCAFFICVLPFKQGQRGRR